MSDEIKTRSGRVVGAWDGKRVEDLQVELARIKSELAGEGSVDRVATAGVPHGDQIPEDLRTFRAYPIWGCDVAENCLCGANANRIVSVRDVRQFSLIDHH